MVVVGGVGVAAVVAATQEMVAVNTGLYVVAPRHIIWVANPKVPTLNVLPE